MMKVSLICSDNKKPLLIELLSARKIEIDDEAEICIVESGFPPSVDKLCLLFHSSNLFTMMELLGNMTQTDEDKSTIVGRTDNERFKMIPYNQIYYFEARGNNTFCITGDGEFRVKDKLYELESKVPHNRFIRIGKSFIANITHVTEITPWFGRKLLLKFEKGKNGIEVSRNYVKSFKEFLGI